MSLELSPQRRGTSSILEHLQMKLTTSCSEVYNNNADPRANYLWGQKRKNNLKSKLPKNMGNIIDVLEREVATQKKKLCNIQEEIITKREPKGNIASARELVVV